MNHFLAAAKAAAAEVIILDPLYSTHDQDENDTRAMAALCQSLLRLRDASQAALIVVHHVRKSIAPLRNRQRLPRLQRPACGGRQLPAAHQAFSATAHRRVALPVSLRRCAAAATAATRSPDAVVFLRRPVVRHASRRRRKVEKADVTQALTDVGEQVRYTQLRDQIMDLTECSKRTAQLAITEACRQGSVIQADGQYRLPL